MHLNWPRIWINSIRTQSHSHLLQSNRINLIYSHDTHSKLQHKIRKPYAYNNTHNRKQTQTNTLLTRCKNANRMCGGCLGNSLEIWRYPETTDWKPSAFTITRFCVAKSWNAGAEHWIFRIFIQNANRTHKANHNLCVTVLCTRIASNVSANLLVCLRVCFALEWMGVGMGESNLYSTDLWDCTRPHNSR